MMEAQDFLVLAKRRLNYRSHLEIGFEVYKNETNRLACIIARAIPRINLKKPKQISVMVLKKRETSLQRQGLARG